MIEIELNPDAKKHVQVDEKESDNIFVRDETVIDTVVEQDDVPPDDDTRPDIGKDLVEGDKIFDFESEDLEEIDVDAILDEDMLKFSMSMKLKPLNLPMIITSLLTTQLSSLNTKPDIKQKENCVDKKETDALKDEVSTATQKTERFPYDPGKTFDTNNDAKEEETIEEDAGKTTPRVPIEDSDVHECSGSRKLIQDDLLFQQVAPSVFLCLHVCHIILRYPAIPLDSFTCSTYTQPAVTM